MGKLVFAVAWSVIFALADFVSAYLILDSYLAAEASAVGAFVSWLMAFAGWHGAIRFLRFDPVTLFKSLLG